MRLSTHEQSRWRSLRSRIVLLAIVTCIFFSVAAGSFYSFLRSSHASTVSTAARHLSQVATALGDAYTHQAAHGLSLRNVQPLLHRPPPPRPPDATAASSTLAGPNAAGPTPPSLRAGRAAPDSRPQPQDSPPLPPPHPADPLSNLTASVLSKANGIEGGFLAGDGPLVGYAFPTHEGPGPQKEMPQRERPTIDQLAHQAESTATPQSYIFEGSHDVILFTAQPVREEVGGHATVTGAVWLMQRLPDLNRGRSQQLLFASGGFGAAALLTALLAWFVTVEVSGGVAAITRRLASLEQDLSHATIPAERPRLAEFDQVLTGIDNLAVALERRIGNERRLEEELRHKERLSSLGQFAAGVAHELRNPLATIRLRAQMSQHTPLEGSVARNGTVILEEVDRLDKMISRLLYFARPISLDLQTIELGELCCSVAEAWQARVPQGLVVSAPVATCIHLPADRSKLTQVLDNLVENAVQASSVPGKVLLTATQTGDSARIDVLDSGCGFAPDALRHAFDPFFTTREAGTGLGLSIAFELVAAHGGELTLASRPGGGAVATIQLPNHLAGKEAR